MSRRARKKGGEEISPHCGRCTHVFSHAAQRRGPPLIRFLYRVSTSSLYSINVSEWCGASPRREGEKKMMSRGAQPPEFPLLCIPSPPFPKWQLPRYRIFWSVSEITVSARSYSFFPAPDFPLSPAFLPHRQKHKGHSTGSVFTHKKNLRSAGRNVSRQVVKDRVAAAGGINLNQK